MQLAYESLVFHLINRGGLQKDSIAISSISARLSTLRVEYFEQLYGSCVRLFKRRLGKEEYRVSIGQ